MTTPGIILPANRRTGARATAVCLCAATVAFAFLAAGCNRTQSVKTVRIGLNLELTGDIPTVGTSGKNASQLFFHQLNTSGGIQFPDGPMAAEPILRDNAAKPVQASEVTQQLILRNDVVAIIGPNSSACAIPSGRIAEGLKTVMISPWSTDPRTTIDATAGVPKRYVFRGCLTDPAQARVLANFALRDLGAKTAAVLYDSQGEPAKEQAGVFRETFTEGGGRVVAFEGYDPDTRDFTRQLTAVREAQPDVIFLPAYYNEVPPIARQARELGITAPFLGTDAWTSPDLARLGGTDLEGSYFCKHFSSEASPEEVRRFVAAYESMFGQPPDDVAALTYDACSLIVAALHKAGRNNREAVREALAQIRGFPGVTGTITFEPGSGDPLKSAAILQIRDGAPVWVTNAGP